MAVKIQRKFYITLREYYAKLARLWNGVWTVIKNGVNNSPPYDGVWVRGNKGNKIRTGDEIPLATRYTKTAEYNSSDSKSLNPTIAEDSYLFHTLGDENDIRNAVSSLNNLSYDYIGKSEGMTKTNIAEKGVATSIDIANITLKSENKDLQEDFNKTKGVVNIKNIPVAQQTSDTFAYPYQTSALNVDGTNVLTYNGNKKYALREDEVVKYDDYDEIDKLLTKIEQCLGRRNNWFDSNGRCQLSCQIMCQHTCQISCQGCNRKQCHDQKCGMH